MASLPQPSFPGTPEQDAIAQAVKAGGNLLVRAYAGTGKTTTIVSFIAPNLPRSAPVLAVAFNKKIKDELEKRLPPHCNVMTLNGLGHRAWSQTIGKRLVLDEKKIGRLITQAGKDFDMNLSQENWADIRTLVVKAMQIGIIPQKFPQRALVADTEENWAELADDNYIAASPILLKMARKVLTASIMEAYAGVITFDDQIYCSALFGGIFPRYPVVIVDEAQDLSPLNHIQIAKCAADRLIVAGDELQSIYAFRGADSESMAKLRALRPTWVELPLTLTFRCPAATVARQQSHAVGFAAHHSNLQGAVHHFPLAKTDPGPHVEGLPQWNWEQVQATAAEGGKIAILCRNNGPLLQMAFKLIRRGIAPVMLGRDIGKGLVKLAQKIMPDADLPALACRRAIVDWQNSESSIALANGKEEKIAGIIDRAECLLAALDATPKPETAKDLQDALTALFSRESGKVTLSSIHRAKGLEWDVVIHLDPWRIPSKWAWKAHAAGDPHPMKQELNLKYVAETRTKDVLILASIEDFS